jgi:hypothetical protein
MLLLEATRGHILNINSNKKEDCLYSILIFVNWVVGKQKKGRRDRAKKDRGRFRENRGRKKVVAETECCKKSDGVPKFLDDDGK